MKKILALTLVLTLLALLPTALAEETATIAPLEGLITEINDDGFLMSDATFGDVQVNFGDDTRFEGNVSDKDGYEVGQYVFVDYNGQMTRSIPPQISADVVRCFIASGAVSEILESGVMLEDETLGQVIVHVGEGAPNLYLGMRVTVYYNGVMAMSLPGQISASYVVVPTLTGVVSELADDGSFTITDEREGEVFAVTVNDATNRRSLPADGDRVHVLYGGMIAQTTNGESQTVLALEIALVSLDEEESATLEAEEAAGEDAQETETQAE